VKMLTKTLISALVILSAIAFITIGCRKTANEGTTDEEVSGAKDIEEDNGAKVDKGIPDKLSGAEGIKWDDGTKADKVVLTLFPNMKVWDIANKKAVLIIFRTPNNPFSNMPSDWLETGPRLSGKDAELVGQMLSRAERLPHDFQSLDIIQLVFSDRTQF
jgi:hypothetical protein